MLSEGFSYDYRAVVKQAFCSSHAYMLIGIHGCSCSGKTTLARGLAAELDGIIVHQDDFYKPDACIPVMNGLQDWDCPEAFDLDRMKATILSLRDMAKLVIVEGILLVHENSPLTSLFDMTIILSGLKTDLAKRRAAREAYETMSGFWVDPPGYFEEVVWPAYIKYSGYLFENSQAAAGNLSGVAISMRCHLAPAMSTHETLQWAISLLK